MADDAPGVPDAPTSGQLQDRAIKASWWTAVQALVGIPLAFVANLVVARTLGPHGFGVVASYAAALGLILTLLNGGVSDATIQWGAASYARGDRAELVTIARRCSGYHLYVEGPLGALAAAVLLRHEPVAVQVVGAASVASTMALGTAVVMLTTTSRTSVLAKQALLLGVALQVSVILVALQTRDPGWVWVVRLAISAVTTIVPTLSLPADLRRAVLRPLLPRRWPPGFAAFAARTLLAGLVAGMVFSRSEVLVLDAYGLTSQAGVFALAVGLAGQITAPVDAMLGPLIPAAASLVATQRDRAAAAIQRGIRLSALATVPIAVIVVPALTLLAPLIYGARFSNVSSLFLALAFVSCVQSALHPVTAFVGALRRPLTVLAMNGVALVVDLGLIVALAAPLGARGAVVANAAGQVVSLLLSLALVRRELAVSGTEALAALRAVVISSAAATGSSILVLSLPADAIVGSLLAVTLACGLTWLLLRLSGGIVRESDLHTVSSAMPARLRPAIQLAGRLGLVK